MTTLFRLVPSGWACVVERSGQYHRTLEPGFSLLVPFLDKAGPLVDLHEQTVSLEATPAVTTDELVVTIDAALYFSVTDARAVTYELPDHAATIKKLAVVALRDVVGGMDMETALTSRATINSTVRRRVEAGVAGAGVQVLRLEINDMTPPVGFLEAWEKRRTQSP